MVEMGRMRDYVSLQVFFFFFFFGVCVWGGVFFAINCIFTEFYQNHVFPLNQFCQIHKIIKKKMSLYYPEWLIYLHQLLHRICIGMHQQNKLSVVTYANMAIISLFLVL